MRHGWLLASGFVLLLVFAAPAAACEQCAQYFNWESESWCKYCAPAHCGFFQCVVRDSGQYGFEYCDSYSDAEGGEECFTDRGGDYCGPDEESRTGRVWRLVKAEVRSTPFQPEAPRG